MKFEEKYGKNFNVPEALKLAFKEVWDSAQKAYREEIVIAWDKLMDKTNDLHDLKCGSCDDEVQEFGEALNELVIGNKK